VVVTGGAGFIGSHVTDALLARGHRVSIIDNLSSGERRFVNEGAELHELDVRDERAAQLIREAAPDAVVHHAAQISVRRSAAEPRFDTDVIVLGSLNLLEAARDVGARFVFASTGGALYGDAEVVPTPETYPAWPVSPYGVSKLCTEHHLHCFRAMHGVSYAALRYSNVYGPRQNPHGEAGVVAIFVRAVLEGGQPVINGDGRQTRDYVYVEDVVAANLLAVESDTVGHFNVGTGRQADVNQLARLVIECAGTGPEPTHGPARPGEQRTSALDSGLIADKLGWRAQVQLEEGIRRTVSWFREQQR
jgi:UDP-glucose 4-epimerase